LKQAVEKVKLVQEESFDVLSKVKAFQEETKGSGKQLTLDALMNKTEEAIFFFNNVVATVVSSEGYFTVPTMPDIQALVPDELQEVIDFCSSSIKDMIKAIEDKAQEELLQLGYAMAEHLHIEGAMDFELEEATQLFRAFSFIAQDWSKIQKTHRWRVRERAVYWATMLSLPSEKPSVPRVPPSPEMKALQRKIKGALTARKALEGDSRALKIADSTKFVAGMRSLMAEVWVDQEAAVKAELDDGYSMCQQLKESYDKEASPKKRMALLRLYKDGCKRLKSAASNMGGMQSASLQINMLSDLSESVMQLQETMKQMQAQLHNIEQGLLLLTGQPVEQVINFYCERELQHADTLPSKVYVPIDGVRIGENRRNPFIVSYPDNPPQGLEDEVMEFLKKGNKSVLLVSGYSGSGKSTLAKRIRLRLWKQHQEEILQHRASAETNVGAAEADTAPAAKKALIVPVWVHLPTLAVPLSDLMHESLAKQHGFGAAQLRDFENKVHAGDYKLVIVMDGVDELKKEFAKNNLYDRNDLELWRGETEGDSWPKVPELPICADTAFILSKVGMERQTLRQTSLRQNSLTATPAPLLSLLISLFTIHSSFFLLSPLLPPPKVLYFCRAEMLQADSYPGYEEHFSPSADSGKLSDPVVARTYFDEIRIAPFGTKMEIYIAAHVALQAKRELGLTRALALPSDTVMARHATDEWRKATIVKTNDDGSYKVGTVVAMIFSLQCD
jgi:hypothetical protein